MHLKHFAVLVLFCTATALSALNWPVMPEPELRKAAAEPVAAFAKEFPGTPDARAAEILLRLLRRFGLDQCDDGVCIGGARPESAAKGKREDS